MAEHTLALVIKRHENDQGFLIVKQKRPPMFNDEEYDALLDSDLWDLLSTRLSPWGKEEETLNLCCVNNLEVLAEKIDLRNFNVQSAINSMLREIGLQTSDVTSYTCMKYVEEAPFGPGFVHTIFVSAQMKHADASLSGTCKWTCIEDCVRLTVDVKPNGDRMGPLIFGGLINASIKFSGKIDTTLKFQEYPPGITLVPMSSKTIKPFSTTNLVVIFPEKVSPMPDEDKFVACGDALVVDPGCLPELHGKLEEIIRALPRKLIIFVTHHHHDHIDGLSKVKSVNPNAILLSHNNTMQRISKENWGKEYTSVHGGEYISIGGQILQVLHAPGHTDGHMGLFHVSSRSLIVGDHCVGYGSAILDQTAGGNMTDYFSTTYKFIDLAPHLVIPMHGRINLWPKNLLCGYLKNRRMRESSILRAIENGKQTLMEIVAEVYAETDPSFWKVASWGVKLHVDRLAQTNMLPPGFSWDTWNNSLDDNRLR